MGYAISSFIGYLTRLQRTLLYNHMMTANFMHRILFVFLVPIALIIAKIANLSTLRDPFFPPWFPSITLLAETFEPIAMDKYSRTSKPRTSKIVSQIKQHM